MCNRAERGHTEKVLNLFGAKVGARFNEGPVEFHPKSPAPIVRLVDGDMILEQSTWGFPVSLRGKNGQILKPKAVNNARFDKLGSFWKRWVINPAQRCLIPTARFAEAVGQPGKMTETWLSLKDQPIFAWAALWDDSQEWGRVSTGVMTSSASELSYIHDRSPVIINPSSWQTWLTAPLEELYQFDSPYPAERMTVEHTNNAWFRKKGSAPDAPTLI